MPIYIGAPPHFWMTHESTEGIDYRHYNFSSHLKTSLKLKPSKRSFSSTEHEIELLMKKTSLN